MSGLERLSRLTGIRANLQRRSLVYQGIRSFFRDRGFMEVDTPLLLSNIIPEQHISPINAEGGFLSTSPEIHMKQMLAAGYGNIFQICHSFRKGERGQAHQPEFTILEWYRVGAGYRQTIRDTELLVAGLAGYLGASTRMAYRGKTVDLAPPWPWLTVREAFLASAGWDPVKSPDPERFDDDMARKVIPGLTTERPVILYDYPAMAASLARLKPGDPRLAERAEVFISGLEIANAYTELTDPVEQETRLNLEIQALAKQGKDNIALPQDFLAALKHLPDCSGIALGVDRLVMLFCDAASIDDVMPFPQ